jgi:hypothetical protein
MEPDTKGNTVKIDEMVRVDSWWCMYVCMFPSCLDQSSPVSHAIFLFGFCLVGPGIYHYPDGRCYTGEYRDDRPHGQGIQTGSDGATLYDGQWTMGEFNSG